LNYTIDTDKCTYCGLCAEDCPSAVITIEKSSETAVIESSGCIECSHCGMICPAGAVLADGLPLQDYPEAVSTYCPDGDKAAMFEHLINSKRSVRNYKPDLPSEKELESIIFSGRITATASNSRQVKAVVLKLEEVKNLSRVISKVAIKVVKLGLNPVGLRVLKIVGLGRYARKELLENYYRRITDTLNGTTDAFFFNAPVVVILTYPDTTNGKRFGRTDCALAAENMMLAAHARGIGSCMIGFAEAALFSKKLRKKAGVTPDRKIGLVFTLGYQKPKYYRYPRRDDWEV